MNKIVLLIAYTCTFITSCSQSTEKPNDKLKKDSLISQIEEVKKSTPETNKSDKNNEWNVNVYRNRFYQFRVEFPKGWEFDNGTSKITLARALQRDISAAISVTVKHLPNEPKNPNNIFESYDIESIQKLFNEMLEIQNINPVNLKIEKGYLNNFPAFFIDFISETKSGTTIYKIYSKQIQCFYKSKIYQINLNVPQNMYDKKVENLFARVYNSFNFEITY